MKFKGKDAQRFLDCCVLYVAQHGGLTAETLHNMHKENNMLKSLPKEYAVPNLLRMSPYFKKGDVPNNTIASKWYLTTIGIRRINTIFVKNSSEYNTKTSQILEKYSGLVNLTFDNFNFCETSEQ